ncbi:MAG: ABC transporter permease [Promethearchaeota archaeon]
MTRQEKILEQIELERMEGKKEEKISKSVISWFFSNLKFLLLPGSRLEELTFREVEYEKTISKRKFLRRLKSTLTILGIVIVFVLITFAVFAPWISPYSYEELNSVCKTTPEMPVCVYQPPSPEHPLGTTDFGQDILGRIIFGARSSLTIALPAILFSVSFGIIFGVIAGYFGGWVDSLIMRIADIFLAFPALILALVFVSILARSGEYDMTYIMLAYGILGVPFYARLIRGSVMQARELPYIQAARASGAGNFRIMFRHILPNTIQPIIISFTFDIGGVILSLAGLSFLGYKDPYLIEWGNDISTARLHYIDAPWAPFWPGFMILIAVLGFMLVGDGLRDALDPRLRNL